MPVIYRQNCKQCHIWYESTAKSFCSRNCKNLSQIGAKKPQWVRDKISKSKIGSKNGMWKGDDVGYFPLHRWVKKRFPKPRFCNDCKIASPYDLANKGVYNRDLSNWEWLCRKCHMTKDGRMKNLKQFQKPRNGQPSEGIS